MIIRHIVFDPILVFCACSSRIRYKRDWCKLIQIDLPFLNVVTILFGILSCDSNNIFANSIILLYKQCIFYGRTQHCNVTLKHFLQKLAETELLERNMSNRNDKLYKLKWKNYLDNLLERHDSHVCCVAYVLFSMFNVCTYF